MPIINKGIFDTDTVFTRQTGNDWPTAQVISTSDVVESTSLYFTNTRVLSALVGANVLVNNLTVAGDFEVQGNVVQINTSVLNIEDLNIVLANGAQTSSVVDGAGIVIHGAQANITYRNTGDKFVINKNTDFTGNVDAAGDVRATGNLVANGLIIRNISVSDSVLSGNVVAGTSTSNIILADSITSNTWNRLYTSNVVEAGTNLYFTNARVVSALIPGTAITIEANGRISSTASTVVTVVNDNTVITTASNTLTYSIGRPISDPKSILVIVEGLIQIPTVDYTVSDTSLTFTSQPPVNTNVEVRFFGTNTSSAAITTYSSGQNITIAANGQISANVVGALVAGSSIVIESNGRISSTATGGTSSDFNPISFMLAGM
jgi:hypothetical protein